MPPLAGTPLTPREIEVVRLTCEGYTSKDVATALGIATKTVTIHKWRVFRRLEIHSLRELVARTREPLEIRTVEAAKDPGVRMILAKMVMVEGKLQALIDALGSGD